MTESSPQLEYAPAPHGLHPVRLRRWLKLAAAALLVLGAVFLIPRYANHASVLLLQRRVITHAAPPQQVIFDSDAAEVAKLLKPPSVYISDPGATSAFVVSDEWMSFHNKLTGGGYHSSGTVFAGELRTKAGRRVLCGIDLAITPAAPNRWVSMSARMIEPGTTYRSPRPVSPSVVRGDGGQVMVAQDDTLRVYAGQRDPANESHVTIDYVLNGTRHTIDAWLEDEGTLLMESRD